MPGFTPARRRGVEFLDDPAFDPVIAARSLRDVALANRLFGGSRAVLRTLDHCLSEFPLHQAVTVLDVGTGLGDIPEAIGRRMERVGRETTSIGLDLTPELCAAASDGADHVACGNALMLPFADSSVDFVTCSQLLHHFDDARSTQLLRELTRVARVAVIVSDLRRSWLAAALLWTASFPLAFHPVSRHDGVVSVLRGFTTTELALMIHSAVGRTPHVQTRLGWRVTASWSAG